MTDPREMLARLNPANVKFDIGRGGVPSLTNQDIAAALAFVPAGVGRELLIACWWPDAGTTRSAALLDAVLDHIRPELVRQTRGIHDARVRLGMVRARAGWSEKADAELRSELAAAEAALDAARVECWPSTTWEMLPALTRAAVAEIARPNHCPTCQGRQDVRGPSGLLAPCKACGGSGAVMVSDRKRAEALGRDESTYRGAWRTVYEWLLAELRDAERQAGRAFQEALGLRG